MGSRDPEYLCTWASRNLSREPVFIPDLPKLLSELTSAVMDENPRFSEVLNLSELRSILYFVPSPPFWRRHTDSVTKNMLTISTKPSACMSVHITLPPFRLRVAV